jgi:hypothetical protein
LRVARALPTASDALDCENSQTDKIPEPKAHEAIRKRRIPRDPREINRPALMRGIVVLAA